MSPVNQAEWRSDVCLVSHAIAHGVSPKYANSKDSHLVVWHRFCHDSGLDPDLSDVSDKVPYLQVFAQRWQDGRLAPRGKPVTSKYVSDIVRSVGQAFKRMGAPDPRLDSSGKIDFRLQRQSRFWSKLDDPPDRVKPIPITMVMYLLRLAYDDNPIVPAEQAFADTICIAFFFLLRPGEYTGTSDDDTAFRLSDIRLFIGARRICLASASDRELEAASAVKLHFTTQKNQRRGDIISHGRSHHALCCPVRATVRCILRHRAWFRRKGLAYDETVVFASYYYRDRRIRIRAIDVTKQLRFAATHCFHATGIAPNDISARSLRAGGAMALLCGNIDSDTIKLVGRWASDAMMRYLHQEAQPIMKRLAVTMLARGDYSFLPTNLATA